MRKHKSHCNKKRVCTNQQHVAKTPATSTAIEREREREWARERPSSFSKFNFEREYFLGDMRNNIEFSCRLVLLLLHFYMQLKNSNKEEKPGKCWNRCLPCFRHHSHQTLTLIVVVVFVALLHLIERQKVVIFAYR